MSPEAPVSTARFKDQLYTPHPVWHTPRSMSSLLSSLASFWQERRYATSFWVACVFFLGLLGIGWQVNPDYGAAWDELMQRGTGINNYRMYLGDHHALDGYADVDYGPFWEVGLEVVVRQLRIEDSGDIWRFRHWCGHLLYLSGVLAFYALVREHFGNRWLALFAAMLLVLMPRFYAHSFFNSKDIPFLVTNIWTLYLARRFLERPSLLTSVMLGATIGWTINLRIAGLMTLAMVLTVMILRAIRRPDRRWVSATSAPLTLGTTVLFNYLTWPYLWDGSIGKIGSILATMSSYRWDGGVLFLGTIERSTALPPTYFPVWAAVTTPILSLIIILAGIVWVTWQGARRALAWGADLEVTNWSLWLGGGLVPVLLIFVKDPVLYDGWRHLYFCFPYWLLLGCVPLWALCQALAKQPDPCRLRFLIAALIIGLLPPLSFMVRNHPFQQVYFNGLVPHRDGWLEAHFERDYWGAASQQMLQYLLAHDERASIALFTSHYPVEFNLDMLTPAQRQRIRIVRTLDEADYAIDMHRPNGSALPKDAPFRELVHQIIVQDSPVSTLYRLR